MKIISITINSMLNPNPNAKNSNDLSEKIFEENRNEPPIDAIIVSIFLFIGIYCPALVFCASKTHKNRNHIVMTKREVCTLSINNKIHRQNNNCPNNTARIDHFFIIVIHSIDFIFNSNHDSVFC